TLSDIPFNGPIAAVRVGRIDGKLVVNPLTSQLEATELNLIVASSRDAIVMVEGGANELREPVVLEALFGAFDAAQPLIKLQDELQRAVGKAKRTVAVPTVDAALLASVRDSAGPQLKAALAKTVKQERYAALDAAHDACVQSLGGDDPARCKQV